MLGFLLLCMSVVGLLVGCLLSVDWYAVLIC